MEISVRRGGGGVPGRGWFSGALGHIHCGAESQGTRKTEATGRCPAPARADYFIPPRSNIRAASRRKRMITLTR